MKKTYTKRQIREAISYWKEQLRKIDEGGWIPSFVMGSETETAKDLIPKIVVWLCDHDQVAIKSAIEGAGETPTDRLCQAVRQQAYRDARM